MWKDTILVVTTDHGYLLGEHEWWAKNRMHAYQEIVHIPLFVHHPEFPGNAGKRRSVLTQTPDLMPTFLDLFGLDIPADVTGRSIRPALTDGAAKLRDALIYGYYGAAVNVTDGRHSYFRYPENMLEQELFQYTLMPTHMLRFFNAEEIGAATIAPGGAFSRGMPTMKVPVPPSSAWYQSHGPARIVDHDTVLFDLERDPQQLSPVADAAVEARLIERMEACLAEQDAPNEVYQRLRLRKPPVAR